MSEKEGNLDLCEDRIADGKNLLHDFFWELHRLPHYAVENFDVITQRYERRWLKDSIELWMEDFQNYYFTFVGSTKNIGKQDRSHILACIMLCFLVKEL